MPIIEYLPQLAAGILGGMIGFVIRHLVASKHRKEIESEKLRFGDEITTKKRELEVTSKQTINRQRDKLESELSRRRKELQNEEDRVVQRQNNIDSRDDNLQKRESELRKHQKTVDNKERHLEQEHKKAEVELQRISSMTHEEAREELLSTVEKECRNDMARVVRKIEEQAKEQGERRAREVIVTSLQRIATDEVSQYTITAVPIPADDMKGRIIGRNGRNIRAFEAAAHVDVIVDDTPESVTVSSFDPIRREVAKRALTKLMQDGRIHPSHIEQVVADSRKDVDVAIKEEGERAAYKTSVLGLRPQILLLLGRLKFRTSYGQEQNAHAVETALLAGAIAAEVGADVETAKIGGLLHDLGKAVDHEVEGTHAAIGAEICRRHGVSGKVCNAIAAHHHEVEQESLEAVIVEVADSISGARPGARREDQEQYIKRIRTLEEIANSFEGVDEAYALQAGREIRVIVTPSDVDDFAAQNISKDVARKIEETMQYPGQIKVTVIRETRTINYAK